MLSSPSVDLIDITYVRKTTIINDGMLELNVDIGILQATDLAYKGTIKENSCIYY